MVSKPCTTETYLTACSRVIQAPRHPLRRNPVMKAESMCQVRREDLHNFTREENETLTRVGPATAMGNLFRQYWIPVMPTSHLNQPGGRPMRIKLLGEALVD